MSLGQIPSSIRSSERVPRPSRSLSALIRAGAEFRRQCLYYYFSPSGGSCALGAAMEALTGSTNVRRGIRALMQMFPALFALDNCLGCPADVCPMDRRRRYLGLSGLVTHLNNDHGWSRERIADWLDSLGL